MPHLLFTPVWLFVLRAPGVLHVMYVHGYTGDGLVRDGERYTYGHMKCGAQSVAVRRLLLPERRAGRAQRDPGEHFEAGALEEYLGAFMQPWLDALDDAGDLRWRVVAMPARRPCAPGPIPQ